MKFDNILLQIGEFGPFQIRIFILIGLAAIPTAFHHLAQVFLAGVPEHVCAIPAAGTFPQQAAELNCSDWGIADAEVCREAQRNASIPPCDNPSCTTTYSQCDRYDVMMSSHSYQPLPTTTDGGGHNISSDRATVKCDVGWDYDRSIYHTSIVSEFDLVCERKKLPGMAQSIYFGGVLIGSIVFGSLADWIGRYLTFFICVILEVTVGVAIAFAPNYATYTGLRFVLAMSNMGLFLMAFVVVTEFVGPSKRVIVGIAIEFFFAFGYMLLALLAFFIRDWRTLQLVISVPVVLFLLMIPALTESPRWLISRGKYERAEKILHKVAKVNNKKLPQPLFEEDEVNKHLEELDTERQPTVLDLFRTPNLRGKTLNLLFNWCVNSFVYYGLSLGTGNLGANTYVSFFLSGAVEVPAYLYALFAIEWFGRRVNLAGTMIIGGVACLATSLIPLGVWRVTVAMIGKFCIASSFAITYVFAAELYPTPVRSAGMGLSSMSARIGGIVAPLILELRDYWVPLPLIVFGLSSILAGGLALLLPETKGRDLPETLQEGELFGKSNEKTETADKMLTFTPCDERNSSPNHASDCVI